MGLKRADFSTYESERAKIGERCVVIWGSYYQKCKKVRVSAYALTLTYYLLQLISDLQPYLQHVTSCVRS